MHDQLKLSIDAMNLAPGDITALLGIVSAPGSTVVEIVLN